MNQKLLEALKRELEGKGLADDQIAKMAEDNSANIPDGADDTAIGSMAKELAEKAVQEAQKEKDTPQASAVAPQPQPAPAPAPSAPSPAPQGGGASEEKPGGGSEVFDKMKEMYDEMVAMQDGMRAEERKKKINEAAEERGIPSELCQYLMVGDNIEADLDRIAQVLINAKLPGKVGASPSTSEAQMKEDAKAWASKLK